MKRSVNNRGLSPVIASVLLILLVLVLAIIIFLWARGFIGEQIEKFGEPIEASCARTTFDVWADRDTLEIRNTGDVNIKYLDIKMFKEGNSKYKRFSPAVDVGESASESIALDMDDDGVTDDDLDNVIIYPVLVGTSSGANNIYTCLDAGVTLELNEIV